MYSLERPRYLSPTEELYFPKNPVNFDRKYDDSIYHENEEEL